MLFSAPLFLFAFLPAFYTVYWLVPARRWVLLTGSLLFYAWGEPEFIAVVLAAAGIDWVLGQRISLDRPRARVWVSLGVSLNLLLLACAKYSGFLASNLNALGFRLPVPRVALPLGVSFFVFEEITYLVDIYRGVALPARAWSRYLNYLLLFPKMLAGPIIKYHDIQAQLEETRLDPSDFRVGLLRFIRGLARKVILADTLAPVVDQVFALPLEALSPSAAWLGLVCFSLQIYFDFSGYSDMAIGLARMMGFRLWENFRDPYLATSMTDFWRRWHISLSSWIREYLYIPLGGSRRGRSRGYLNLSLCFLASGLWHGAAWTFVVWGCVHGFGLVFDRVIWLETSTRLPRLLRILLTDAWVGLSWVFFRCTNLAHAWGYLLALSGAPALSGNSVTLRPDTLALIGLGVALIARGAREEGRCDPPQAWLWAFPLLLVTLAQDLVNGYHPFIYFRF